MGLKSVHVVFITACTALAVSLVFFFVREYRATESTGALLGAAVSAAGGAGLAVYGTWFLKKMSRLP